MVPTGRLHRYTYSDYVVLEESSSTKHEYLEGEIYAMAGGSEEHSAPAAEVLRALGNAVGDWPCRVHTSDLRLYVEATGMATFPDGSPIRGQLERLSLTRHARAQQRSIRRSCSRSPAIPPRSTIRPPSSRVIRPSHHCETTWLFHIASGA